MVINPLVISLTRIECLKDDSVVGSATGFFYSRNDKLFFVTNRHVFHDKESNLYPDVLRLFLHCDADNLLDNEPYDISLYTSAKEPIWKEHPDHKDVDIAIAMLDKKSILNKFIVKAFSASDFLPSSYQVDLGEDIFIVGYPLGFFDDQHNLPIFRNATIASVYGVNFANRPYFLTDANLHPGMSGGPVIRKPRNTWIDSTGNLNIITGSRYYLMGIHSGTYSVPLSNGTTMPLGIGVAWYIQLVEDICIQFN